jgi:hypothetical protein
MKVALCSIFAIFLVAATSLETTLRAEDKIAIESFISTQAHRERGEEYKDGRKILLGDVNRDSVADVDVLYTIESQGGSYNYVQYLAVFLRKNNKLVGTAHISVGGKSFRSVELTSIANHEIRLQTLGYTPKDPTCCPTLKGETRYILSGGRLLEK